MCCLIAHNPGALGCAVSGQCSGPSPLFPQLSNILSGPCAGVTQLLMKPSCHSLLLLGIKKLQFQKKKKHSGTFVVRVLPLLQGDEWGSLSLSPHFQIYSQGALAARRLKSPADPKQKARWFPTISFLPTCPHAISLQAVVPKALTETKESHNQCVCWQHPVPSPSRSQPHQWT